MKDKKKIIAFWLNILVGLMLGAIIICASLKYYKACMILSLIIVILSVAYGIVFGEI